MAGKFMFVRKFENGKEYAYHYPRYSALARCRSYLRKPGAALVPVGHAGRWIGAGDIQFQNRTVQHLIKLGFAELIDGAVRKKVRPA